MNIQQLEYIIAVDRAKSFTKAAEQCFVTQATLSAMIKKLEEELGVILFDRKGSPVITTEIGQVILDEARQVIIHSHKIKDLVGQQKGEISGTLRIGIIPTIASSLLPRILKLLSTRFPALELIVTEMITPEVVEQVRSGRLDAGIIVTPWKDLNLEEIILYYETLMVYGMEKMERKYIMPFEIQDKKIWMLEEGHCLREQFINYCSLKKKTDMPGNLKFEGNSFETLLNLVDSFGGLTLIPELYYQLLSEEKKLKVKQFSLPIPVREVSMIYHRPYARLNSLQAVSGLIQAEINQNLISSSFAKKDLLIVEI